LEYDIHGLSDFLKGLKKLDFSGATRRARVLWDFLVRHLAAYPQGTERGFFRGEYKWQYYKAYTRHFDVYFLTVLRSKAWLPGKDGELHKPSELLPQELASGFTRHPVLCDALQMKAELAVKLAKEFGVKVEDLMLIRQHRGEFEKFKRSVKEKPAPSAKPVEQPSPATPAHASTPPVTGQIQPQGSAAEAAGAIPAAEKAETQPPSANEVAGAINDLLGSDSGSPT